MAGLNLFFIAFVCFAGFIAYCLIAIPLWKTTGSAYLAKQEFSHRRKTGLFLLIASYLAILFATHTWNTRPAAVFKMAFGFQPPASVHIASSRHYILGDEGEHSLSFTAPKNIVDQLLRSRFDTSLAESTPDLSGSYSFEREFSDTFTIETVTLLYNPKTNLVQYHWLGTE